MFKRKPSHRHVRSTGARALAGAAALAGLAVLVQARSKRSERCNPPLGKFVDVNGTRLHYLDRGSGPSVVLLHGNGSMIQDFQASGIIDLLAREHRVIAFDRPGYGYSERPRGTLWTPAEQAQLIAQALSRLGEHNCTIVGHSWGALIAAEMALLPNFRIRALGLLSGYYFPTARLDVALLSAPALPLVGDLLRYTVSPIIGWLLSDRIASLLFAPAPISARFSEFPVSMALRPSPLRASAEECAFMIPAAKSLSKHYDKIGVPILIMAGAGDKLVERNQAQNLKRRLPASDLRIEPHVGHMIHHTRPQLVAQAIGDLAKR